LAAAGAARRSARASRNQRIIRRTLAYRH